MSVYRSFNLPHIQPIGASFSITLTVLDAVPGALLKKLNEERQRALWEIRQDGCPDTSRRIEQTQFLYDRKFNRLLRRKAEQSHPFADERAAKIMVDVLKKYANSLYYLCAYSVMSNHVHAEIDTSIQLENRSSSDEFTKLHEIVRLIKGSSSYQINKLNGTRGQALWPRRYRDRFIRSEHHLMTACKYTLENPVKAGITTKVGEHPFTGGMTTEELAALHPQRVYPNPKELYEKLSNYDKQH